MTDPLSGIPRDEASTPGVASAAAFRGRARPHNPPPKPSNAKPKGRPTLSGKMYCDNCRSNTHFPSRCKLPLRCSLCGKDNHTAQVCNVTRQGTYPIGRCYNCDRAGHSVKQCPQPVVCKHCNEPDHTVNMCWRLDPARRAEHAAIQAGFYANTTTLLSRLLPEFEGPLDRLRDHSIQGTLLFVGSTGTMPPEAHAAALTRCEEEIATSVDDDHRAMLEAKLAQLKRRAWNCDHYVQAEELARLLTEWTMKEEVRRPPACAMPPEGDGCEYPQSIVVCTGGGRGIMEAANKGAASVPGAKTMGMRTVWLYEKESNPHVTPGLSFEFRFFFTGKFWMLHQPYAIVAFPGGCGTLGEVLETITLKATGMLSPKLPIVLFGEEYWRKVINWPAMVELGTVSKDLVDGLLFTDDVEEAFAQIVASVVATKSEASPAMPHESIPGAL